MWLLVMLVLGGADVMIANVYYPDEIGCQRAAAQFESQVIEDYKLRAFCIKGE
jgi:hypothetical protein